MTDLETELREWMGDELGSCFSVLLKQYLRFRKNLDEWTILYRFDGLENEHDSIAELFQNTAPRHFRLHDQLSLQWFVLTVGKAYALPTVSTNHWSE
ncbi:MAG: hypothetical protein AAFO79_12760, partial [Pseudomonadota bacterium]